MRNRRPIHLMVAFILFFGLMVAFIPKIALMATIRWNLSTGSQRQISVEGAEQHESAAEEGERGVGLQYGLVGRNAVGCPRV